MKAGRFRKLLLSIAMLGLLVSTATAQADELQYDLCDIPFTELHRQAVEEQHLPAITSIFLDWMSNGPLSSELGTWFLSYDPKNRKERTTEDLAQNYLRLLELIKGEKAGPQQSEPADLTLPPRPGPARPIADVSQPGSFQYKLTPAQKDALDQALQALLHWACHTENATSLVLIVENVRNLRADGGDPYRDIQMLTYADWLQYQSIIQHYLSLTPRPSWQDFLRFHHLPNLMIENGFSPDWFNFPDRVARKEKLQLQMAEWADRKAFAPTNRLYALSKVGQSYQHISYPDGTASSIYKRMLIAYLEETSAWNAGSRAPFRQRAEAHKRMAFAALHLKRPDLGLCFIKRLVETIESDTNGSIGPNARKHLYNSETLRAHFAQVLGEQALSVEPAPFPCTNL